jgi:phosphate:Na+ symporter
MTAVLEEHPDSARHVLGLKRPLYDEIDHLGAHLGTRLWSHDPNRIEVYRLESRVLEIERRIYYFAKRIAKTALPPEEGRESTMPPPPDDGNPS